MIKKYLKETFESLTVKDAFSFILSLFLSLILLFLIVIVLVVAFPITLLMIGILLNEKVFITGPNYYYRNCGYFDKPIKTTNYESIKDRSDVEHWVYVSEYRQLLMKIDDWTLRELREDLELNEEQNQLLKDFFRKPWVLKEKNIEHFKLSTDERSKISLQLNKLQELYSEQEEDLAILTIEYDECEIEEDYFKVNYAKIETNMLVLDIEIKRLQKVLG